MHDSSGFSTEGIIISASAIPHCGDSHGHFSSNINTGDRDQPINEVVIGSVEQCGRICSLVTNSLTSIYVMRKSRCVSLHCAVTSNQLSNSQLILIMTG